jgi:hypothetical protein
MPGTYDDAQRNEAQNLYIAGNASLNPDFGCYLTLHNNLKYSYRELY